jgi:hypothetical protein
MKARIKSRTLAILCATFLASVFCAARPANSQAKDQVSDQWVGIWQGTLDGQPSVTLTIANDTGAIGGTLVLNLIKKENGQSQIAVRDAHVLVAPRIENGVLSFEVKRKGTDVPANFTVTLLPSGDAEIHCLTCGADAPAVEMTRLH